MDNPTILTLEQVKQQIIQTAHQYAYQTEDREWFTLPQIVLWDEGYVAIAIQEILDRDYLPPEAKQVLHRVQIATRMVRKPPDGDTDELSRVGTEMLGTAVFVNKLRGMNLAWIESAK